MPAKTPPRGKLAITLAEVRVLGKKYRNWGRWGQDDELGCLNFVSPAKIAAAARLVKKGQAFALATAFDANGPQPGGGRRFNPVHTMLATGSDVLSGGQDNIKGLRYADDVIAMPLQCATQWDGLGHVFDHDRMWNGRSVALVNANGALKNGIESMRDKIQGRGILLDVARWKKKPWLEKGEGITPADLEACAKFQKVTVGEGDFLIVRTGHMSSYRQPDGSYKWGDYAGGDAPGVTIETVAWLYERRVASIASDTWGVEVRPNATPDCMQPWHLIALPNMGLLIGEIFYLDELAADCARDKVYEFFFCAPPLPITGAVGSPVNPMAIK